MMDNQNIDIAWKNYKKQEYEKQFSFENRVKQEYAKFCCWCRAFKNAEFTEKNFKEYQKQEKTNFDFWMKKRIAELFFGYKFEFNYDTYKWNIKKRRITDT